MIESVIEKICECFGDDYWFECDCVGGFLVDFYVVFVEVGWFGIVMDLVYGGVGFGMIEVVLMMCMISVLGVGLFGVLVVYMNIFGLNLV